MLGLLSQNPPNLEHLGEAGTSQGTRPSLCTKHSGVPLRAHPISKLMLIQSTPAPSVTNWVSCLAAGLNLLAGMSIPGAVLSSSHVGQLRPAFPGPTEHYVFTQRLEKPFSFYFSSGEKPRGHL